MKSYIVIPIGKLKIDFGWYEGENPTLFQFTVFDYIRIYERLTIIFIHIKVAKAVISAYWSNYE